MFMLKNYILVTSIVFATLTSYGVPVPLSRQWIQEHIVPASLREALDDIFNRAGITAQDMGKTSVLLKKFQEAPDKFYFYKIPQHLFGDIYSSERYIVFEAETLPTSIIKLQAKNTLLHSQNNLNRVVEAERINTVAQNLNAQVRAPKKYLYPLPGSNQKVIDKNYGVVAEKIQVNTAKTLDSMTDKQFHDLCEIIRETYFGDVRPGNIVFDLNDFVVIWDTEPVSRSFMLKPNYDFYGLGIPPLYELLVAYKLMEHKDAKARRIGRALARAIFTLYWGIMPLKSFANTASKKQAYTNCITVLTNKVIEDALRAEMLYPLEEDKILKAYQGLPTKKISELLKQFENLPNMKKYEQAFKNKS